MTVIVFVSVYVSGSGVSLARPVFVVSVDSVALVTSEIDVAVADVGVDDIVDSDVESEGVVASEVVSAASETHSESFDVGAEDVE